MTWKHGLCKKKNWPKLTWFESKMINTSTNFNWLSFKVLFPKHELLTTASLLPLFLFYFKRLMFTTVQRGGRVWSKADGQACTGTAPQQMCSWGLSSFFWPSFIKKHILELLENNYIMKYVRAEFGFSKFGFFVFSFVIVWLDFWLSWVCGCVCTLCVIFLFFCTITQSTSWSANPSAVFCVRAHLSVSFLTVSYDDGLLRPTGAACSRSYPPSTAVQWNSTLHCFSWWRTCTEACVCVWVLTHTHCACTHPIWCSACTTNQTKQTD